MYFTNLSSRIFTCKENRMKHIIRNVVMNYFKEIHTLVVEEELHKNSWHTDLHYKIIVNGKRYSARFINSKRTINPAFGALSNEQLMEQVRFTYYVREHEIPFMQINKNRAGSHLHLSRGLMNNTDLYYLIGLRENILHIVQKILQKPLERKQERYMIFLAHFKVRFFKRNHIWMGIPSLFIC